MREAASVVATPRNSLLGFFRRTLLGSVGAFGNPAELAAPHHPDDAGACRQRRRPRLAEITAAPAPLSSTSLDRRGRRSPRRRSEQISGHGSMGLPNRFQPPSRRHNRGKPKRLRLNALSLSKLRGLDGQKKPAQGRLFQCSVRYSALRSTNSMYAIGAASPARKPHLRIRK